MKTLFAMILALGVLMGNAQNSVSGLVTDKNKKPLEGVTVSVPETDAVVTTNDLGLYLIQVPEGAKALRFAKEGYRVEVVSIDGRTINVTMNLLSEVDIFELSLEDLLNVEIVTASKYQESISETPATVLVIT